MGSWREYLRLAPRLPRSLALTGSGLVLALLSYGFRAELWPSHPAAGHWSLALLPVALVVGILQVLSALRRWPAAIAGPVWLRLALRAGVAVVQVGVAVLLALVLLASLVMLALLS